MSDRGQIIYTILGVPFGDLAYLTTQNAIRTNGSATAQEASLANQYVAVGCPIPLCVSSD